MSFSAHTPGGRFGEGGAQTGRQARAAHEAPGAALAPAGLQATASRVAGVTKQGRCPLSGSQSSQSYDLFAVWPSASPSSSLRLSFPIREIGGVRLRLTCVDTPPSAWHGQGLEREPLFLGKVLRGQIPVTQGGGVIPYVGGSTLALAWPLCLLPAHGKNMAARSPWATGRGPSSC